MAPPHSPPSSYQLALPGGDLGLDAVAAPLVEDLVLEGDHLVVRVDQRVDLRSPILVVLQVSKKAPLRRIDSAPPDKARQPSALLGSPRAHPRVYMGDLSLHPPGCPSASCSRSRVRPSKLCKAIALPLHGRSVLLGLAKRKRPAPQTRLQRRGKGVRPKAGENRAY